MYNKAALKAYLQANYKSSTVKVYLREIEHYLAQCPSAATASYPAIRDYLKEQRKHQKSSSMNRILQGIKKYYQYLVQAQLRVDNPIQYLYLKDQRKTKSAVVERLLTTAELAQLWEHWKGNQSGYKILRKRNLILLSLVLYQGLRVGEIKALAIKDIDLENNLIHIAESSQSRSRSLPIDSSQLLLLYQYLTLDRQVLTQANPTETALLVTRKGEREGGETLHTLVKKVRNYYPGIVLNPSVLRKSVIANQFKAGKSLQVVQYFAGHRYPSSTARYKSSNLEALKAGIMKHHPLG